MVSFEIFVKAMPPSLLELKVLPSFCFAFKIPDDVAASKVYAIFYQYQDQSHEKADTKVKAKSRLPGNPIPL